MYIYMYIDTYICIYISYFCLIFFGTKVIHTLKRQGGAMLFFKIYNFQILDNFDKIFIALP